MSVFFCVISSACIMRFSLCGFLCRCGAYQAARSTINPPIAMYAMAYGIAAFKISPSRPCISQACYALRRNHLTARCSRGVCCHKPVRIAVIQLMGNVGLQFGKQDVGRCVAARYKRSDSPDERRKYRIELPRNRCEG